MRCVRCPPHQHLNPEPSAQRLCFMSLCCSAWDTSDGTSTPTLLLGLGQIVVGNAVVIMGLISMNWSLLQCQNHLSVLFPYPAEAHTSRTHSTIRLHAGQKKMYNLLFFCLVSITFTSRCSLDHVHPWYI